MTRVFVAVSLLLVGCNAATDTQKSYSSNAPGALIIAYMPDSADTFVAVRKDSVIALDWLREVTTGSDIPLEVKSYPFGSMIELIGPRKNGDGGFWLYKVNGQAIPKSADGYTVAWSDTLTFFFDER